MREYPQKKKPFLLLAAIISFLIAAIVYWGFENYSPNEIEEKYSKDVQENVLQTIEVAEQTVEKTKSNLIKSKNEKFGDILHKSPIPYCVYEDGKLIFWSDASFIPSYTSATKISSLGALQDAGRFLLVRRSHFTHNGKDIDIVAIISLLQQYRNENYHLTSHYNLAIFKIPPQAIGAKIDPIERRNIKNNIGNFLFSINLPSNLNQSPFDFPLFTALFLALGLVLSGLYIYQKLKSEQQNFEQIFIYITGYVLLLRILLLLGAIPRRLLSNAIFDSKNYNNGILSPTFGDHLINTILLLGLIIFTSLYFQRTRFYEKILNIDQRSKNILSVVVVFLSILSVYLFQEDLLNLYTKSSYVFSLSFSLHFSYLKASVLAYYVLLSAVFFLIVHLSASLFSKYQPDTKKGTLYWVIGSLIAFIALGFFDEIQWTYVIASFYFFLVYAWRLTHFFYLFRYKTSNYFLLGSFVFALIATYISSEGLRQKTVLDKKELAASYLLEKDLLAEELIYKISQKISQDSSVIKALERKDLAEERIKQRIREQYLDLYLDKYDIDVLAFDATGRSLAAEPNKPIENYLRLFAKNEYKTAKSNLFYLSATANKGIKAFAVFTPIYQSSQNMGIVLIHLTARDLGIGGVQSNSVNTTESKGYSYGLYNKHRKLLLSSGTYNYNAQMPFSLLRDPPLYNHGVRYKDYNHLASKNSKGDVAIISSKDTFWESAFISISFLFLLSSLFITLMMLIYGIRYGFQKLRLDFSTKIQIYLNAASLLPLILVVIVVISVIRSTLMEVQESSRINNARNISSSVEAFENDYSQKKISKGLFEQQITHLARGIKTDINLYDTDGKLSFTTRPLIYEYKLISPYINTKSYLHLIENRNKEITLDEKIGEHSYKMTYINAVGKGNLGVIAIPFFDADAIQDEQELEVVISILSIFVFLFLFLSIVAYLTSNVLTNPLRIVAQRLKSTDLDTLNEPIEWDTPDEIGMLTQAYNNMLQKLEENKVAFSQTEKQTAWREIAKQVAHEIKNPLTPMKLTLQQLQRTLQPSDIATKERMERALNSLSEQIDNINEIANSFSEFAKMPVPRTEIFDWVNVIQKTADLYLQNSQTIINTIFTDREAWVVGDRQFMSRIITNLILNGLQSVQKDKTPIINIRLRKNKLENFAIMEVQDNGNGIPEGLKKKVFIPNFSTKIGGSGLGLAMAKRGIEHAGGNIWFESQEGQGTTFFVELKMANGYEKPENGA